MTSRFQGNLYRVIILSAMTSKPRYGYELKQRIESIWNKGIQVNYSVLYRLLREMEKSGWINGFWEGDEGTRRRHYYSITPEGEKVFEELREDWASIISNIDRLKGILEL